MSLEADLERARDLEVDRLADAVESIGFECTRCGACCKGYDGDRNSGDADPEDGDSEAGHPHTATVFPDEVRRIQSGDDAAETDADGPGGDRPSETAGSGADEGVAYDWRDVARPMPYGLTDGPEGPTGETFEWALQTDDCGDCTFYEDGTGDDPGRCTVHGDRPLICRTYPFSVALGTSEPMGEAVDREGIVRAHECEGLGRSIDREDAEELARALKERAVRELEEAIAVRDAYEPVDLDPDDGVVVHDSEGAKRPDGTPLDRE